MDDRRTVEISGYPRIHACLIDLGEATSRIGGGLGFSLDGMAVSARAKRSDKLRIKFREPPSDRSENDVYDAASRTLRALALPGCDVYIDSSLPEHQGFGSKTTTLLTVITAIYVAHSRVPIPKDIQHLSGRGGLSGIGVHSFFKGGVIIDGGHARPHQLMPSSKQSPDQLPPIVSSFLAPEKWRVALILPRGRSFEKEEEVKIFQSYTPLAAADVLRTLSLVYHGLAIAFLNHDLSTLSTSLKQIHQLGFKKIELQNQSKSVVAAYYAALKIRNTAVGMSSMGPLLYVIYDVSNENQVLARVDELANENGCTVFDPLPIRKSGYSKVYPDA